MRSRTRLALMFGRITAGTILALGMFAASAADKPAVALKEVAKELTSPTALVPFDKDGRLLVADQVGMIYLLNKDGEKKLFFDLRDRLIKLNQGFDERGVIGLALHPKFAENRRFFVMYSAPRRASAPTNWDCASRLVEFKVQEQDRTQADSKSERVLLEIDKPYFNHNGGCIVFGPDGYLYIGVGDGGNANDAGIGHPPQGNGQDRSTLLGKILRIDIDKGDRYSIPSDNPFVNGKGAPEIYAYGMRNPWRITFDRGGKHELFAADIGQNLFEEVDIIVKGGNYGWNIREGFHCFDPKEPKKAPADCPKVGADGEPLLDPILEYKNINGWRNDPAALGISITGGYVYRGQALPHLVGRYVFGDWSRTWALPDGVLLVATRPPSASGSWSVESLPLASQGNAKLGAYITAFGEDAAGELYVLTNGRNSLSGTTGKVFKLVPATE